MSDNVHPTAIVHPTARIADSVRIGAYSIVGEEVEIDEGTVLHEHVVVQRLTRIGRENEVYPFAVLGADPQDRKFDGERSLCVIGDRNKIREHVTIHRGTANGGGVTVIGNDSLLMVASHVAHDCRIGDEVCLANQVMLAGHASIESGANIGGGAGIHHFATVGRSAFVGGLARITRDVPPFMIVEGNPAEVRGINSIAMSRRGYDQGDIDAMKDAFRRLFRENGAPMSEKLGDLRREHPGCEPVRILCDALAAAAGGVHGRALENFRSDDKRISTAVPTGMSSRR